VLVVKTERAKKREMKTESVCTLKRYAQRKDSISVKNRSAK
jgi:hypothetical protein